MVDQGRLVQTNSSALPSRQPRVKKLLQHPHVLVQTMSVLSTLTAHTQAQFLEAFDKVAERMTEALRDMIRTIPVSHEPIWSAVRGKPIGFLDGGMAAVEDLGTEPLAVRVGSYIVRPGVEGSEREEFGF